MRVRLSGAPGIDPRALAHAIGEHLAESERPAATTGAYESVFRLRIEAMAGASPGDIAGAVAQALDRRLAGGEDHG